MAAIRMRVMVRFLRVPRRQIRPDTSPLGVWVEFFCPQEMGRVHLRVDDRMCGIRRVYGFF